MIMTKRKPVSVGEILTMDYMEPLGLTQGALAEAMGVPRQHINELVNGRRSVTIQTAAMLAKVFDTSIDFWLNTQKRTDLWNFLNSPKDVERLERVKPIINKKENSLHA